MATYKSLQHIIEKPLQESSSLLDSLSSWNQIKSLQSIQQSSFTELFGELHFKDNSASSSSPEQSKQYASPRKWESLQLCTEGLGFESSDDVEDLKNDIIEVKKQNEDEGINMKLRNIPLPEIQGKKSRSRSGGIGGEFPPPISCIGISGKPKVSFKSYREDGRFVLKQVKIPIRNFLNAHREEGRLKLHFVQPTEEEEDEDNNEEENEEETCFNN